MIGAGFKTPVSNDIRSELWVKLWGNLTFNPVSALTHATLEDICSYPLSRELAARMMTEARAVGEKLGVATPLLAMVVGRWDRRRLRRCGFRRLHRLRRLHRHRHPYLQGRRCLYPHGDGYRPQRRQLPRQQHRLRRRPGHPLQGGSR